MLPNRRSFQHACQYQGQPAFQSGKTMRVTQTWAATQAPALSQRLDQLV